MAVTLIGSNGLFTRLGKIFGMVADISTHQADVDTEVQDILGEYSDADQYMLKGLGDIIESMQIQSAAPFTKLQAAAVNTVIEMVHADANLLNKTLRDSLIELIRQMESSADDVDGNVAVLSIDSVGASNTGNGTVVFSNSDHEGNILQNMRNEKIKLTCTTDRQVRGTPGQEVFSVIGEYPVADIKNVSWPSGSGINSSVQVSDPAQNAMSGHSGKNHLHNSDFEDFTTTNQPDNWSAVVGSIGTDIVEEGTVVYRGSKCLAFAADGSTLTAIDQDFGTTGQTVAKLSPSTKYMISVRVSAESGVTTGTLRFSIKDNANNIVGSSNLDVTLSGVSTGGTFDHFTKELNMPGKVPAGTKFVIEFTVAADNTKSIYIDDLALFPMTQFGGPGGPYVNVIPGSTAWVEDDVVTLDVSNPHTGDFAKHFDRFFSMYSMGLQLPYDTGGTETISDALIA